MRIGVVGAGGGGGGGGSKQAAVGERLEREVLNDALGSRSHWTYRDLVSRSTQPRRLFSEIL